MSDFNELSANLLNREVAVISHNVVGLHAEPDPSSGLISQLVSGMQVRVIERRADMTLIEGADRYRGWLRTRFLCEAIDHSDNPVTTIAPLIADVHSSPSPKSQILTKMVTSTPVVLGRHSTAREFSPILLPTGVTGYTHRANLSSSYNDSLNLAGVSGIRARSVVPPQQWRSLLEKTMDMVVASALRFVGTPYLWGGSTPFGIDCSGLTQLSFRVCGLQLLRDASLQFADRRFVAVDGSAGLSDAVLEPGDLVFFAGSNAQGEQLISHVGLAIGDGSFVHAAGQGMGTVVTPCDAPEWERIYVGARRLSPDADLSIDAA